jgi:hypothetical protein
MAMMRGIGEAPRGAALREAIAAVPMTASISAQEDVVPHVASRVDVHAFPDGEATDEYVLLDRQGASRRPDSATITDEAIGRLRTASDFTVLVDEAGVLLVKRVEAR